MLTSVNVSALHAKYTLLYSYVNQERSRANVELLRAKAKEGAAINDILRQRPTINAQEKWRRDAAMNTEPRLVKVREEIDEIIIKKEIAEMYLANYEKYIAALSRELSRKTSEQERYGHR